jgi:hypothetical protein
VILDLIYKRGAVCFLWIDGNNESELYGPLEAKSEKLKAPIAIGGEKSEDKILCGRRRIQNTVKKPMYSMFLCGSKQTRSRKRFGIKYHCAP